MWENLKSLHLAKRKIFWVLALVEAALLLAAVSGLFGKDGVYRFDGTAMTLLQGSRDPESGAVSIDESYDHKGKIAVFQGIRLEPGVYRVSLEYQTDTDFLNHCDIRDNSVRYKNLLSNGDTLYAGLNSTDFDMWLKGDTDQIEVSVSYGGQGSLTVKGLKIYETNAMARIGIFLILALSLLVDACWLLVQYNRQFPIPAKTRNIAFGLLATVVMAAYPLGVDTMSPGADLVFHLNRVEGIKDGLLAGQFPVRIAPEWQHGYGYASSIFYGDTVLALQAMFRLIGFTVTTSYRLFQLALTVATVLVSYYCFRKIFREPYIGLLCSMLYSLSVYRMYKTYYRGAYGEAIAILFLPLLAYGFYRVFSEDIHTKEYQKSWIPLTIGFSGLLQSHFLSGELAGLFTILLCVVLWKKVFRRQTFVVLAKTVLYSCIISAWFLVPFLDYTLTGNFVIQNVSARTIQERGLYLAQLLRIFLDYGENVIYEAGIRDSAPETVGASLLFAMAVWCLIRVHQKRNGLCREEWALGRIAAGFAVTAIVFSLSAFPWTKIQFHNSFTRVLVSSLQFPDRFLTVGTLMLVLTAGVCGKWLMRRDSVKEEEGTGEFRYSYGIYCLILCGLLAVSSVSFINSCLDSREGIRILNREGMGMGYVSGGEYLPYTADASLYVYRPPIGETEGLAVQEYEKNGLTVRTACVNSGASEGILRLPLLYYKGYRAYDQETGEELKVFSGQNFQVSVTVPAGYEGTVLTKFVSPWYWRVAEIASAVAVAVMAVSLLRFYRRASV